MNKQQTLEVAAAKLEEACLLLTDIHEMLDKFKTLEEEAYIIQQLTVKLILEQYDLVALSQGRSIE